MSIPGKFPAIPDQRVVGQAQVIDAIRENVEILTGRRGLAGDRAVLVSEFSKPVLKGAILLNGWTNYGNGHAEAGFWVHGTGLVMLTGAITAPSTFVSTAFSLGREYAPPAKLVFPAYTTFGGLVQLEIAPVTGDVSFPTSFTGSVYMDGACFVRAQSG